MRCGYGVVFPKKQRHRASSRKLRDDGGCEKSSNVNESQREREGRETVSSISTVDTLDTISSNISKVIFSDDCIYESMSSYTAGFEPTNEIEWSRASFGCFHDDTPCFPPAMFPR